MQKRIILVLILIAVSLAFSHNHTAAKQPVSPASDPPAPLCRTMIQSVRFVSSGITQARWSQRTYWCYDQTQITYWEFKTGQQVFSNQWAFRGPYAPVTRSTKFKAFIQTSALFKKELGSPTFYWRPYVQQIVSYTGEHEVRFWSRRW